MTNYNKLNAKELEDGKEIIDILDVLDEDSKKIVLVYASGLRDRQMISEDGKIA